MNAIDREVINGESMFASPFTLPASDVAVKINEFAEQGVTEIAFQPMGNIERELSAFALASGISTVH
jgi:hypothetical protein